MNDRVAIDEQALPRIHRKRQRLRRKSQWRLVRGDAGDDDDGDGDAADFAASVERDINQLPTLDESDRR